MGDNSVQPRGHAGREDPLPTLGKTMRLLFLRVTLKMTDMSL